MRRREFIALLGTTAAAWPFGAEGQQPAIPLIGFLSSRSPDESKHLVAAFREGLRTSGGYIEGQNVAIEYHWAEGHYDRLPAFAADLVRRKVTVLVTVGGEPSAMAAKAATSTIPIVFTIGGDPVKAGLVASYNRPGGNATGVRVLTTPAETKRLGLLHQVVPGAAVIGALVDPNYSEFEQQSQEVREAARALDRRIEIATPGAMQELEPAFAALVQRHVEALLVCADPFFDTQRDRIVGLAAQFKLPAIYQFREYAVAGGLMSYGISLVDGYRQVGIYAGQVLKGAKPAELPVYETVKFEFVVNLKTAKTLGIKFSDNLLSIADEVIE
jgi:putative ABC transport system substrate-binding protein